MASQEALKNLQFSNYGYFAVVAFLAYEHLITFETEVTLFWKKQFTGASLLFFVNRYLTIAWAVATAASPYYSSPQVGYKLSPVLDDLAPDSHPHRARGLQSVEGFLYFPWAVFSALRVYALGRTWPLAVVVFILSMMPNIAKFAATFCIMLVTGLPDHSPDCKTVQGPITKKLANTFTIVSRTSLVTAEVIVLVVTWIATYRRGVIREKAERQTVAHVVLFNGTTYFLVMLFLNCLQLGFTLAAVRDTFPFSRSARLMTVEMQVGPTRKVLNVSEVTTFSEPITSVLITRFLFDLQRVNQRGVVNLDSDGRVSPHSDIVVSPGTLRFRGMFDSLGSLLVWEEDQSSADEDNVDYDTAQ
ncbi:hypothetical protein LXA43DRAFT_1061116 [Ganoderma leucocontextum]|nr:hypothetical protein LXA43DRAFT_1061116 [Ganoderma leucocontextum]